MTSVEDAAWRRPSGDAAASGGVDGPRPASEPAAAPASAPPSGPPGGSAYAGPPRNNPPPPGWRPEFVVQPPPPRTLPAQDHSWLDVREAAARTVTYGVGLVAGAVLLVALCALCGRAWF